MTAWTETYRGAVPPWQCDVTEHFTVAYYFDRLEEADANLADELGLGDLLRRDDLLRRIDAHFARELRAGASFHVESAALSVDNALRLGHRFVHSTNGEVVTWFEEHWHLAAPLTPQQRAPIEAQIAVWNGPGAETRPSRPRPTSSFPLPEAEGQDLRYRRRRPFCTRRHRASLFQCLRSARRRDRYGRRLHATAAAWFLDI